MSTPGRLVTGCNLSFAFHSVRSVQNLLSDGPVDVDRELITSEIIYWLYQVLTGKDSEFLGWPAAAALTTKRKQLGLGTGTLQDWVQELLKKVVFKVSACFVHA